MLQSSRPMARWLNSLVLIAAIIGPPLYWHGGVLDAEAASFVIGYTADRPWPNKIFDPAANDFDAYQARELSYVIDAIDANTGIAIARRSGGWLLPVSSMIASALIAAILLAGMRRTMPGIDALTATLLVACLISSFQFMSTMGIWYRSSKPWLTVVVLALLFFWRRRIRDDAARRADADTHDAAVTFALCVAGGLLDRQGFFYAAMALAIVALHYWRCRQMGAVLIALAAAVGFLTIYNLAIAPWLIHSLNGYWPDFEYQARAMRPSLLREPLWRATQVSIDTAGELFGGSRVVATALIAAALYALVWTRAWSRSLWLYVALAALGQLVMLALMIRQHPPIYEMVDHEFWYYLLPGIALLIFCVAMAIDTLSTTGSTRTRWAITVLLAAITVSNIATLRNDRRRITEGPYFAPVYAQSEVLKASLRQGQPAPAMTEGYREIYDRVTGSR